jgi:hypothetical protein
MRIGARNCAACRSKGAADSRDGASIATRSMSARSFFDTNVLVYTDANDEPIKQVRALELIEQGWTGV